MFQLSGNRYGAAMEDCVVLRGGSYILSSPFHIIYIRRINSKDVILDCTGESNKAAIVCRIQKELPS